MPDKNERPVTRLDDRAIFGTIPVGISLCSFAYRDLNGIAEALAYKFADRFCDTDDVADVAVSVLDAHIDDTAVIGRTVEGRVYLHAPLAELLADVVGEDDVRSVHISVLPDNGVELIVLHFSRFITLLFHLLN